MTIETIIIIIVAGIFLAILFFLYRLFNQKKLDKYERSLTTEIEAGEISIEKPETSRDERIFRGEMDILVRNKKISTTRIGDREIRIGRDPLKSTVVIAEPTISKLHCTVFTRGNQIVIRDNDSTNGIYVNNKKHIEYDIQDHVTVSLGKTGNIQLLFRLKPVSPETG